MQLPNLYQTVTDKGNPEHVNKIGPFKSKTSHWLGEGYYFWDSLLDRAHWWGKTHCHGQYMICQACAEVNDGAYLDLAGNMLQLKQFEKWFDVIRKMHNEHEVTVSFAIEKLRRDDNFPFQAVRALSEKCGGDNRVNYVCYHDSYLNLSPPMQICIYSRDRVKDYHVIFPDTYVATGVI